MDISDIENTDDELSFILLDFIDENITDETEVLDTIIDSTQSASALLSILDTLNEMVKETVKTIDKITK